MYLVFSIGVVLVNRSQKMIAVEQRPNIAALSGGEGHGESVKCVELISNRFVKEQENQNRWPRLRALHTRSSFRSRRRRRRRRRIDLVHWIRQHRHTSRRRHISPSNFLGKILSLKINLFLFLFFFCFSLSLKFNFCLFLFLVSIFFTLLALAIFREVWFHFLHFGLVWIW